MSCARMDSHQLIDAQFDRAVEIIQGLPKTGPIQTGYEEKLTMYRYVSCYTATRVDFLMCDIHIVSISKVIAVTRTQIV